MKTLSETNLELHPVTKDTLDLFIRKIIEYEGNNLLKVILFGSVARGDSQKDSDIDVLVILKKCDSLENRTKIWDISVDVMLEMDYDENAYLQVLPISEEDSKGLNYYGLMFNVDKEGLILYDTQH
jgi:predicted nucleotidyltransferase